jgi:phage-related protein
LQNYSDFAIIKAGRQVIKPKLIGMNFRIKILEPAKKYIQEKLNPSEQGILKADIEAMAKGEFGLVKTKKLRRKIHELIFGYHRITFFQFNNSLYFIRGFRKKTNKTPKWEIDYAESIYKIITQ